MEQMKTEICHGFGLLQLDWSIAKVKPFVSSIRSRLQPTPMPFNIYQDRDGLPRIILTEPKGSSAEVGSCSLSPVLI